MRVSASVITTFILGLFLSGVVAFSQEPSAPVGTPPDLPSEVTLAQLVARKKHTCVFVGGKDVGHSNGPAYTASLAEVMPQMLAITPTSLDRAAAAPNATRCLKSFCAFVKRVNCPNDLTEAMIRANCREKIYKNCDIINAAASKCSPERVAQWRAQYPDAN